MYMANILKKSNILVENDDLTGNLKQQLARTNTVVKQHTS